MRNTKVQKSVFGSRLRNIAFRLTHDTVGLHYTGILAVCLLFSLVLMNDACAQSGSTNSGGLAHVIHTAIESVQASPGLLVMILTSVGAIFSAALGNFSLSFLLAVLAIGGALVR
jgi:hypothetical protein